MTAPKISASLQIVDPATGLPTIAFVQWFNNAIELLFNAFNTADNAQLLGGLGTSNTDPTVSQRLDELELQLADAIALYAVRANSSGMSDMSGKLQNALTVGTGLALSAGTTFDGSAAVTLNNSKPDQTVTCTPVSGITITGTYPNFSFKVP